MSKYQPFRSQKQKSLYVHIETNVKLRHAVKIILNQKEQCLNQCKKISDCILKNQKQKFINKTKKIIVKCHSVLTAAYAIWMKKAKKNK